RRGKVARGGPVLMESSPERDEVLAGAAPLLLALGVEQPLIEDDLFLHFLRRRIVPVRGAGLLECRDRLLVPAEMREARPFLLQLAPLRGPASGAHDDEGEARRKERKGTASSRSRSAQRRLSMSMSMSMSPRTSRARASRRARGTRLGRR